MPSSCGGQYTRTEKDQDGWTNNGIITLFRQHSSLQPLGQQGNEVLLHSMLASTCNGAI